MAVVFATLGAGRLSGDVGPWDPSLRTYRQESLGVRAGVFERIGLDPGALAAARSGE